jgi:hypothetical protein
MKVRNPYRCDYCPNQKGDTNHWWLHPRTGEQFTLLAWNDKLADQENYEHICGEIALKVDGSVEFTIGRQLRGDTSKLRDNHALLMISLG